LRLDCGGKPVLCCMEGHAKGIADDLKDEATIGFARSVQNGVMARPQGFPRIGMLLRKFGTAFDICKEECNGAGWDINHRFPPGKEYSLP